MESEDAAGRMRPYTRLLTLDITTDHCGDGSEYTTLVTYESGRVTRKRFDWCYEI